MSRVRPCAPSSRHLPWSALALLPATHPSPLPPPLRAVRRLPSQTSTCAPGHRPATRSCGSLRGGSPVRVNACTQGPAWCDVTYRGSRGWVSARYLDFGRPHPFPHPVITARRSCRVPGVVIGTPVITFQFGTGRYYDDHHRYDRRDYRRDYRPLRRAITGDSRATTSRITTIVHSTNPKIWIGTISKNPARNTEPDARKRRRRAPKSVTCAASQPARERTASGRAAECLWSGAIAEPGPAQAPAMRSKKGSEFIPASKGLRSLGQSSSAQPPGRSSKPVARNTGSFGCVSPQLFARVPGRSCPTWRDR